MGSCYSRKAGGGKYTYSTVQMASTKLEDSSRLARPTPYSRGPSGSFPTRKAIPVPLKPEKSVHSITSGSNVNAKSTFPPQSSIPRFTTGVTATKAEVNENFLYSQKVRNENSSLHVVNNNAVPSSQSAGSAISFVANTPKSLDLEAGRVKMSTSSKSFPENMTRQLRAEEKSGISRSLPKSPQGIPVQRSFLPMASKYSGHRPAGAEPSPEPKKVLVPDPAEPKCDKLMDSGFSELDSSKSSYVHSDSHDSIVDIDSGLGSSLTDKNKQEDGDTLKDAESLKCTEAFSVLHSVPENKSPDDSVGDKSPLKCPVYKRSLNGKWVREDNSVNVPPTSGTLLPGLKEKAASQPAYSSDRNLYKPVSAFSGEKMAYKRSLSQQFSSFPSAVSTPQKPVKQSASESSCIQNISGSIPGIASRAGYGSRHDKSSTPSAVSSGNHSSAESDDKSDGLGSETKSPTSDIENRVFLIDDEISDQPNLICALRGKVDEDGASVSLQQSVTELHVLQQMSSSDMQRSRDRLGSDHRDSILSSELGSSCSSIASDDLMLDFEKKNDFPEGTVNEGLASPVRKTSEIEMVEDQLADLALDKAADIHLDEKSRKRLHRRSSGPHGGSSVLGKDEWRLRSVSLPLRPPRPMSVLGAEDGSIVLDSSSYRLLSQDLQGVKTLLLRLKSVIQEAETISPFDRINMKNFFYKSLVHNDSPAVALDEKNRKQTEDISLENADLKRQLVLLQQQLEEKNRTIHLLQQQMTKYTNIATASYGTSSTSNAATQTERPRSLASSLSSSVDDGSMETLVSVQDAFEEHVAKSLKEQNNFLNQVEEVSRSLNSLCQDLHPSTSKCLSQSRSRSSADLCKNTS